MSHAAPPPLPAGDFARPLPPPSPPAKRRSHGRARWTISSPRSSSAQAPSPSGPSAPTASAAHSPLDPAARRPPPGRATCRVWRRSASAVSTARSRPSDRFWFQKSSSVTPARFLARWRAGGSRRVRDDGRHSVRVWGGGRRRAPPVRAGGGRDHRCRGGDPSLSFRFASV